MAGKYTLTCTPPLKGFATILCSSVQKEKHTGSGLAFRLVGTEKELADDDDDDDVAFIAPPP